MPEEFWTWLASCQTCGRPHEYRLVENCDGPPGHYLHHAGRHTWADPVDGHAYRRRFITIDVAQVRAEWERHTQETRADA